MSGTNKTLGWAYVAIFAALLGVGLAWPHNKHAGNALNFFLGALAGQRLATLFGVRP